MLIHVHQNSQHNGCYDLHKPAVCPDLLIHILFFTKEISGELFLVFHLVRSSILYSVGVRDVDIFARSGVLCQACSLATAIWFLRVVSGLTPGEPGTPCPTLLYRFGMCHSHSFPRFWHSTGFLGKKRVTYHLFHNHSIEA